LLSQLTRSRAPNWPDQPPGSIWTLVDPAHAAQIEAAGGIVSERFAYCQTLPLDQAAPLAEVLRGAGYRPLRWRPYRAGEGVEVAAVWARDGVDWQLAVDLDL